MENSNLNSFKPHKGNVKILGRTFFDENAQSLWLGHTDTGVEYQFKGKISELEVRTSPHPRELSKVNSPAHIVIFADGKRYLDKVIQETVTSLVVEFEEVKEHTIRFLKVSECLMGTVFLYEIRADADRIEPTPIAEKKIEFIGDSITCAYGVDSMESGSVRYEDGTKSYAYKTSQKFHADYSICCFTSYGIYSGFSYHGIRNATDTVPQYYTKLGYTERPDLERSEATYRPINEVVWDPSNFSPDLIVINLGTNDMFYLSGIRYLAQRQSEMVAFQKAYEKFLSTVRSIHPKAHILCTIGIMGNEIYPLIKQSIQHYIQETGDTKVDFYLFSVQNISKNGVGYGYHPSPQSHEDASNELVKEIERLYGWKADPNVTIDDSFNENE